MFFKQSGSGALVWFGERDPKIIAGALKARCVCKKCNIGWMSTLESHAKKVLTPLMHDISFSLDLRQQWLLAVWSVKTAMTFECTQNGKSFYTKEDRHGLLSSSTPPRGTTVWIGRHAHSNIVDGGSTHLNPSSAPNNPLAKSYVTTFALSRLILQVFTIRIKPEFEHVPLTLHLKPGPWNRGLIQIWPITASRVLWPPSLSFSDAGTSFEQLRKRFLNI